MRTFCVVLLALVFQPLSAQPYFHSVYAGLLAPTNAVIEYAPESLTPKVGVVITLLEIESTGVGLVGIEFSKNSFRADTIYNKGVDTYYDFSANHFYISPNFSYRFYLNSSLNWYLSPRVWADIPIKTERHYQHQYSKVVTDHQGIQEVKTFNDEIDETENSNFNTSFGISFVLGYRFYVMGSLFSVDGGYRLSTPQNISPAPEGKFGNEGFSFRLSYYFY